MEAEMEGNPIASPTLRMQRLERECRRLRWLGISGVLSAMLVVVIGGAQIQDLAPPSPSSGVTVLDKAKNARAALDVGPDGPPYLALYDAKGISRLMLYLSPDGTPISGGFDKDGGARVSLGLSKESPILSLFDQGGKERVSIASVRGGRLDWSSRTAKKVAA
jgi:hypothetical protein